MTYYISSAPNEHQQVAIDLPASKSLSNRALILKALCDEDCQLSHLSDCDDTRVMLQAFEGDCRGNDGAPRVVDIGAAGTSMRFLTAYFAAQGAEVIMAGSERMKQRPIGILVNALRELGADIQYMEQEGFPPLRISGKKLKGGALSIDGSTSSQYISALLMIAPCLTEGLQLTLTGDVTSRPYIEMTRQMMREFGVQTEWVDDHCIHVAPQKYKAKAYAVESDWSAASYWYEIALFRGFSGISCRYLLKGLKQESLQGDSRVADFFAELGLHTSFCAEGAIIDNDKIVQSLGSESDESPIPDKVQWDLTDQPDLAQTLIVTCCAVGIHFDITGLHTLRIKETDRIAALQTELRKFGHVVHVEGDNRMIFANEDCEGELVPMVATYHDHRMAMAFAPLAILGTKHYICHPEVVSKSYPTYWDDQKLANFQITEHPESEEEIRQHIAAAEARQKRVHTHAKWVLNFILVFFAAIITTLLLRCCGK